MSLRKMNEPGRIQSHFIFPQKDISKTDGDVK